MPDLSITQLKKIIFKFLPRDKAKAFVFGSRADGTNRKYSDIDLGIISKTKISPTTMFSLEEEFDNSDLPYKVDLVDFSKVSDNFKKVALKNVLYLN